MKNFKLILSAAAATLFFGCSDLAVSDNEAYAENVPADFNYKEYVDVNPKLRFVAITNAVESYNTDIRAYVKVRDNLAKDLGEKATLAKNITAAEAACVKDDETTAAQCATLDSLLAVKAAKTDSLAMMDSSAQMKAYIADSVNFYVKDSTTMHSLFLKSWAGALYGYSDEEWAKSWDLSSVSTSYDTTKVVDTTSLKVKDASGEEAVTKKIYVDTGKSEGSTAKGKITYDTDGVTIVAVDGYTDTTYTEEVSITVSEKVTIEKMANEQKNMTRVTVASIDSTKDTVFTEGLDPSKIQMLSKFNFIDQVGADGQVNVVDDIKMAEEVGLDSANITLHYALTGKLTGWPYRHCTEAERSNPRPCEEEYQLCEMADDDAMREICFSSITCDLTGTAKLYCFDEVSGFSREIK